MRGVGFSGGWVVVERARRVVKMITGLSGVLVLAMVVAYAEVLRLCTKRLLVTDRGRVCRR